MKKSIDGNAGISKRGDYTEKLFQRFTSFPKTSSRKEGDFVYMKIPIEVKKVTLHRKKLTGAINQIRSLKNSILVVRVSNRKSWLIVGPRKLLQIISDTKKRGQHCESPFECSNLTVQNLLDFGVREVRDSDLELEVIREIRKARKDDVIKELTRKLLDENQRMAQRHIIKVKKTLAS